MLRKVLAVLVIVILGSIAAQELMRAVAPIIPILIILGLAAFLLGGGISIFRGRL